MQCFELKPAGLWVISGGLYTNRIQIGILDRVTRSSWFIILNLTFAAEVAAFYRVYMLLQYTSISVYVFKDIQLALWFMLFA